jgi:hypothetical protein
MVLRGLFLFFGEAFRDGPSDCRTRDTPLGFERQKAASETHNILLNCLREAGHNIDVALHTHNTRFESELKSWYQNTVFSQFLNKMNAGVCGAVENAINDTFASIDLNDYDFLFVLRFDLYLKPSFLNSFDPNWDKVMFMNAMHYIDDSRDHRRLPHISDPFIFIPKSLFFQDGDWKGLLNNSSHLLHHKVVGELVKNGLSIKKIGFISNHIYPTNTSQCSNPFFRLSGRNEGPEMPIKTRNTIYIADTIEFIGETW